MQHTAPSPFSSTERKILLVVLVAILGTGLSTYAIFQQTLSRVMTATLVNRSDAVFSLLGQRIPPASLTCIRSREDAHGPLYRSVHRMLANTRHLTAVRYLYTASRNAAGQVIYVVDGLPLDAADFRYPGDLLESEVLPMVRRCLDGQTVCEGAVLQTSWGKIIPACAPIADDRGVVGALVIEYDLDGFATDIRRSFSYSLVTTGVIALGIALLTGWLLRRLAVPLYRRLAYTDLLTGVYTRNAFELDLRRLHNTGAEKNLVLLSCDLNLLKTINDQRGHAAGDATIRTLAGLLVRQFQDAGQTYRIGGDEFVTVLHGVSPESVLQTITAMEAKAQGTAIAGFPLSFAWGVAAFDPEQDANLHATLTRADARMYARKHACKKAPPQSPARPCSPEDKPAQ